MGTSSNECSDIYRGPKAFSEIEVKQVADYLKSIKSQLAGYIDIHAYSQMWMTPWGYTRQYPRDYSEMVRFLTPCGYSMKPFSYIFPVDATIFI